MKFKPLHAPLLPVLATLTTLVIVASPVSARADSSRVTLVPIVGFERTQKVVPTPHITSRLIYGVRLTAGLRLLSAETEYTHGTDSESFPAQNLSTKDTADRLKLGVRSTFMMSSFLATFLRAGVQATRNQHEETNSGVTARRIDKIKYSPYAGTGLDIRLMSNFSLTGGVTVVFNSFPDMKKNDYQTTLGFTVRFP